jgi:hypothetical protein
MILNVKEIFNIDAWVSATPFNHLVVDNFLPRETCESISREFPIISNEGWHVYENPIEIKKAMNSWDRFGPHTYALFWYLNSRSFIEKLEVLTRCTLYPDFGLNGGGLHTHRSGGKHNTHLDYSMHPKLPLQRRLNLILYLTPDWREEWGGHLGFWSHDAAKNGPKDLVVSIPPFFNRAVLFDTTQNSWHGLPEPINCPEDVTRNSLAVYYLCEPGSTAVQRSRALFAPYKEQANDKHVLDLIDRRSDLRASASTYISKT